MKKNGWSQEFMEVLDRWLEVENMAVFSTAHILQKCKNPVLRMFMEIIQHDSLTHYRIMELLKESMQMDSLSLQFQSSEWESIRDLVEGHIELEKETLVLAQNLLNSLLSEGMDGQKLLIKYLMLDEQKHNRLLADLRKVTDKKMAPAGG